MTKSKARCFVPKCKFSVTSDHDGLILCWAHYHTLDQAHKRFLSELYQTQTNIAKLQSAKADYIKEIREFIKQKTRPLNK